MSSNILKKLMIQDDDNVKKVSNDNFDIRAYIDEKLNQKENRKEFAEQQFDKMQQNKDNRIKELQTKRVEPYNQKKLQEQQYQETLRNIKAKLDKEYGINNINVNNKQEETKINLPVNPNIVKTANIDKSQLKEVKEGDLYKLSKGKIDDRNNFQKIGDNVTGIGGNILMGAESVIPSVSKYVNTANELALSKAGEAIANQTGIKADKTIGNALKSLWNIVSPIGKANQEINSSEMQKWRKETIESNINKTTNPLTKKVATIMPSVGQNIANMGISAINPALGTAMFVTSAAGGYLDDAEKRGMNADQAFAYATVMGSAEGLTEKWITGDMLSKARKMFDSKGISKDVLSSYGTNIAENFFQEAVMEPLQEATAQVVAQKGNSENLWNRTLESGLDGVLSAILLSGASVGIAKAENALKSDNITEKQIQDAIVDTINSGKVDINNIVSGAQEGIKNISVKRKNKVPELILNTENKSNNNINLIAPIMQENANTEQRQIGPVENNNINMPEVQSQELTTRNTAEKYANKFESPESMNRIVTQLERIAETRNKNNKGNLNIVFDDSISGNGLIEINGDNRTIRLNPNSQKPVEFVLIHELSHDIKGTDGYNKLVDLVKQYNDGQVNYDKAYADIKNTYENYYNKMGLDMTKLDINEEVTNDILGTALGTQEFVNRITQQDRNFAQKIYDWIKKQINIYKSDNRELTRWLYKVQDNFEKALKQQNNLQEGTKNLILTDPKGYKYVKADRQVISGNNPLMWEQQVENYINDEIREGKDVHVVTDDGDILTITKDTAGKAKFRNEIIDKNGNKRRLNDKEFMSKLRAETHIDELAETSKHKNGPVPDSKNHSFAKDGFTYRTAYFEDIDGQYYKITMSVGKNGNINTIYNIGKMQNAQKNRSHSISELKGSSDKVTSDRISSINSIAPTNNDVNTTTTKYSMQESENNVRKEITNSNLSSFSLEDINSKINSKSDINKITDNGITMTYVHMNNKNTANYGNLYGQNIEPAGEYMNMDTLQGKYKVPGADYGIINFKNPLILNHTNTGENGWKMQLSEMFQNKTGKKLTEAIKKAGYDAVITIDEDGNYNEIVNINGKKLNSESENNSGSFSIDNKGRKLSKEQQDFFKNSKVVDEKGNLKTVYHGTPYEFNQFKYDKLGENTSSLGAGFYFTDRVETAEEYKRGGGNVKEVYLDISKPLSYGKTTMTKSEYINFIEEVNKETNGSYFEDYDGIDNALMEYEYGGDDIDLVLAVKNASGLSYEKIFDILRKTTGFDGIISDKGFLNNGETLYVALNSNQIKNVYNTKPTSSPDIRYSQSKKGQWNNYLNELDSKLSKNNTRTKTYYKLPVREDIKHSVKNDTSNKEVNEINFPKPKKILNPTEISKLTNKDATTTPIIKEKTYEKGNKQSSFLGNVLNDAQFLNEDLRQMIAKDKNVEFYKGITNEETLKKAYKSLQDGGAEETMRWFNKQEKNVSAEDVAKGWILLKQYQDNGDYQGAVEVAKKMRNIGTQAGQTVQAYNILARMTPEGMFYYAQSELSEAFDQLSKNKTKQWIDEHKSEFELTPEDTQFIKEKMESIQGIEDERIKKIALAEIQTRIKNKIPPKLGDSIKAWMRISMLFNPKTQIRNIAGNAGIAPVNAVADAFSGLTDKLISKKTGTRTTGITKEGVKGYVKGFGKGLYESYDDFRKGINTRNIDGNRFEISQGKSFKNKGIGKALNKVDNILTFALDAGDRGFYEASFVNSINNQLVLNNTEKVTPEMIDIATTEALQRTWQDNNEYTAMVLRLRNALNKLNLKGYGLGDVLIPFAKTPANLTKAIVDYSPLGLTKTLAIDARNFKKSLSNGQYSPQLQHKFVQNLGKGMAGSLLYVLGYALAKAGISSGEADDDKDVKNFMKNSLGVSSYSIKIGNTSFTYDWTQPVATPFAIMANFVKYNKDNPDASAIDKAIKSMNIGTEQLLQQSFMESLNTVLNGNGTTLENLSKAVLDLPARAIPTFSKQIADMVDGTQRTSFEYDKPLESAINSIKAKLPVASKSLPVARDTLGNEIKKYGGDNNVFNVMFNPANMNKGSLSKAGEEIYNVYMQTGDATILPRTAPYYINSKGEKITMSAEERNEFQKTSGQYVEKTLNELLSKNSYQKLSEEEKTEIINNIVSDSYSKAKYDVLNIDSDQYKKLRNTLENVKASSYYDYKFKTSELDKSKDKINILINSNYNNKEKTAIYENYIKSGDDNLYNVASKLGVGINDILKYKAQDFESDRVEDGTTKGKSLSGSKKNKVIEYLNNQNMKYNDKLVLLGMSYALNSNQKQQLYNYIINAKLSNTEKFNIFDKMSSNFITYKDGTVKIKD